MTPVAEAVVAYRSPPFCMVMDPEVRLMSEVL